MNQVQRADALAQIKSRLRKAERGRLRHSEHVRRIRNQPQVDMFELRWQDVNVSRYDALGVLVAEASSALVRLYYVEQPGNGSWMLGLHAHEKELHYVTDAHGKRVVDAAATEQAQNGHIEQAAEVLRQTAATHAGVPELSQRFGHEPLAS